jgi:hypothetical protein
MIEKTGNDYTELTDYFAKTVHEFVDRLHERAAGIEKMMGGGASIALDEMAMDRIDREVDRLQGFFEKNPTRAALMAFGVGAIASRFLETKAPGKKPELAQILAMRPAKPARPKKPVASKAPAKKAAAKKAPVKKAAAKKASVKQTPAAKAPVGKAA